MTSPSFISFWFFIGIIYVVIVSKPVSSQTPLINNICHRTTFVDYCRRVLMSNPMSASPDANLYILGKVTCNFIGTNVTESTDKIAGMMAYEQSEPQFQNLYNCFQAYSTMGKCTSRLSLYWGHRKFKKAEAQARTGISKVAECEAALSGGHSPFQPNNLILRRLFIMVTVMSGIAA